MAASMKVKQGKQNPVGMTLGGLRSGSVKALDPYGQETAGPEGFPVAQEGLGQSLKDLVGDGLLFNLDSDQHSPKLMALQRMVGNQAVQRILQRDPVDKDAGLPEDLKTFRAKGPSPADAAGSLITPSTGMGGFNARYDPASMVLTIKVNIGMNFLDGMAISGFRVTAKEDTMKPSAIQINRMLSRLRGEKRDKALEQVKEQWTWNGAADPRIAAFMGTYRANVSGAWGSAGSGLMFQGTRKGWEAQLAKVNVVVNTENITSLAVGAAMPGPRPVHCQANIFKTPDANVFGANVAPGTAASGTDQFLSLGSGQVVAQSHILTQSVFFANNSSTLDSEAKDKLRKWIISFQATPGTAGDNIAITGHANTKGEETEAGRERNLDLSLKRALAVDEFLKTTSVEGSLLRNATTRIGGVLGVGAAGAGEEAGFRKVDIVVGSGQGQNIAAHEFGHMLGLDDEYASTPKKDSTGKPIKDRKGKEITRGLVSGTGGDVGTTTGHNKLAGEMGLGGSVHENNDNIMSLGSTIRPQHYATFMKALHTVSGITDWKVKA